jgi:Uma2 family endonuclease
VAPRLAHHRIQANGPASAGRWRRVWRTTASRRTARREPAGISGMGRPATSGTQTSSRKERKERKKEDRQVTVIVCRFDPGLPAAVDWEEVRRNVPMSVAAQEVARLHLAPHSSGVSLTPAEFDAAEFEEGWRYELIHGVLVVSPRPLRKERDPNEELGRWLRNYQEAHPEGWALDATFHEETVVTPTERRRADRVIYAGLGRDPQEGEVPTVVVEFVSAGKRNLIRDYVEKRDEYLALGVREYWIVDCFARSLTVYRLHGSDSSQQVVREGETYATPLLPGFELRLDELLQRADRW